MDTEILSLIKPKRLYQNKMFKLYNNVCKLELGATEILAPFHSKLPNIKIPIYDLWSDNLDEALPSNEKITIDDLNDLNWEEIIINSKESSVFSSLSSVGEDLFYFANISLENRKLNISYVGLTYAVNYCVDKEVKSDLNFNINCDWNVFYYLFQMFKELNGKKVSNLLWYNDRNNFYFTNSSKTHFIKLNKRDKILEYKELLYKNVKQVYSEMEKKDNSSKMRKILMDEISVSETKHLLRALDDVVKCREAAIVDEYSDDNYTVIINKVK